MKNLMTNTIKKIDTHTIKKGQVISQNFLAHIHITKGQVWMTAQDNFHDFVLIAGDFLNDLKLNNVVIEALTDTEFQVSQAPIANTTSDIYLESFGKCHSF